MNAPPTAAHPVGRPCTVIVCPWKSSYIGSQLVPVSTELIEYKPDWHSPTKMRQVYAAAGGLLVQEVDVEPEHRRRGNRSWYPVQWMVPNGLNPYDDTDEFDIDNSLVWLSLPETMRG